MKSYTYLRQLLLLIFCALLAGQAHATHIRAGEITARRVDPQSFTYEITLRGYTDRGSSVIFGSNGTLDFGDGTRLVINNQGDDIPRTALTPDTWLYELKVVHTFPSARSYSVSFREFYRNDGTLNMDNPVQMPFYIETVIVIDPFLGINNTPQLLYPPVDKAAVNKLYIHNPGAYDVDGDSLAYRLVVCRQDRTLPVANYRFPHETFPPGDLRNGTSLDGGPPELTLDPITGDLVWNTPGTAGQYNVAFFVEEWRKIAGEYYLLGYVTRDMQILVEDDPNNPPVIEVPEDICVIAGTLINSNDYGVIRAVDPDGDNIDFSAFGGVFELGATFSGTTGMSSPAEATFSWQTNCSHIRERPYQVVFRARDVRGGGVSLTAIKTWNITVVAPPPVVESVRAVSSRSIEVNFDGSAYGCKQARSVQVWRREGSIDIPLDTCITGMPPGYGYVLADVRDFGRFPYVDNGGGAGLKPGATYCYRFVTVFPNPQGGESLVSEEKCVTLPAKVPLMTNVSIMETSTTEGEIWVRWIPGPDLTPGEVAQPYFYDLYRAEGFSGGDYTLVAENLSATEFTDTGLNTQNQVYNYYVMLKDANRTEYEYSDPASTVRLDPVPQASSILLQWQAQVPWSNSVRQYPLHEVYRNRVDPANPDLLVKIAEVNVLQNGFRYVDDGSGAGTGPLEDDVEYCYRVVTAGSYSNPQVPEPLLNNSQEICSFLRDDIPPCPPLTFELASLESCEEILQNKVCSDNTFENRLSWTENTEELCIKDFSHWLIYYSYDGVDFRIVGQTRNNQFTHVMQDTLAGFYFIQAVDRSGNLSEPSQTVMRDNCPNYWLPNVITRNGDGKNDVLRPPLPGEAAPPERCPRFVESVEFTVYNRWGKEVYSYNSATAAEPDIYIRWDGRGSNGNMVSTGTYYYVVNVTYRMLDPDRRNQKIKGWVYILDGADSRDNP
jgi:hypothetical protein